jgi:uncharacterized protein (TIGR03437 family)
MILNVGNRCALAFLTAFFPVATFAASSITLQYTAYTTAAGSTGTVTLNSGQSLNLETGAAVSSGGDLAWNGTTLTPVGKALAVDLTGLISTYSGASGYSLVTETLLKEGVSSGLGSANPFTPAQGDVIGMEDNSGNVGKLLVTSLAGGTGTGGTTTPTITGVQNNYSLLVPGLPNYGIAPGTLFIITGQNLSSVPVSSITALQSSSSPGIPTTLNGAQITVTVGTFTAHPGMYYAGATQIAAVLPSATPAGTGTITVSYGGATSNAATITVVTSALGLDTYYGTGSGLGVATDAVTGALITYTNSAKPGESLVFWGSGLGSDSADSDTIFTTTPHAVNIPITIYIGGVAVTPGYAGSSGYPGLNQINVTLPANVPTGCGVSVVAQTGSGAATNISNTMALPIGASGGVCTDPILGYNGTTLTTTTTQSGSYNYGTLSILQDTIPTVTVGNTTTGGETTGGVGFFEKTTYSGSTTTGGVFSLGSCSLSGSSTITVGSTPTVNGLDAGNITITGPTGTQPLTNEMIPTLTGPSGEYFAQLANSFFPPTGGTFTFTGTGGKDIGAFTASIGYTNPLTWTNMTSITSVTRASGQQITWTGGQPNSWVLIGGSSSSNTASASFNCLALASAGQFTIPSYVLLALPAGANGTLAVNNTNIATFSASGLTSGYGQLTAGVSFGISPTYN